MTNKEEMSCEEAVARADKVNELSRSLQAKVNAAAKVVDLEHDRDVAAIVHTHPELVAMPPAAMLSVVHHLFCNMHPQLNEEQRAMFSLLSAALYTRCEMESIIKDVMGEVLSACNEDVPKSRH